MEQRRSGGTIQGTRVAKQSTPSYAFIAGILIDIFLLASVVIAMIVAGALPIEAHCLEVAGCFISDDSLSANVAHFKFSGKFHNYSSLVKSFSTTSSVSSSR